MICWAVSLLHPFSVLSLFLIQSDISMETFEEVVVQTFIHKLKVSLRHVDSILIIWPHGTHTLHRLLEYLNNQQNGIKFTMEIESNSSFPFFDILLSRLPDARLVHSVYQKLTNTN